MSNALELGLVKTIYEEFGGNISNEELYERVAAKAGISSDVLNQLSEVGEAKTRHSLVKRKIRWYQQALKMMGVIERVDRGVWKVVEPTKAGLHEADPDLCLLGFSTALGVGLWGDSRTAFSDGLGEPIHLVITSPPYPLQRPRNYGNQPERAWVDWLLEMLEPIVRQLAPGGSLVINLSNDIFQPNSPARSTYVERLTLALQDDLKLYLMDRLPWINRSKAPGPTKWACVERVQLCVGWEPVLWFTNDPHRVFSDNRRVLEPHTSSHLRFLTQGNQRVTSYGDGAFQLRGDRSYARVTEGKIPKNIIERGHTCADTLQLRRHAKALGLPAHSAVFPTALPDQLIRFLTEPGQLVVDLFAGWFKVALAAERAGRRWICVEKVLEHVRVAMEAFRGQPGYYANPYFIRDQRGE
ncbi:DNA methyltransferase [Escherichia coli]|uniref:site-specific DNA-methyltransferase n=1 Tax=Aeromonas caviae TaxID=648 RepID=UPI0026495577|nr:site-specific DNA-methyltransferase [Aeromonas caviae]MDN6867355.1 site-specific DNA-methyltransferase [Aeromonas caviae]